VLLGAFLGQEDAGGLDHHVGADLAPLQVGGILFLGQADLLAVDDERVAFDIDFALEAQKEGKDAVEAIYEACVVRFRPIMMTTMAALMGTIPIALGFGAGAESRRPLGLAVVGGLLFSQTLTLFVTPVFYVYMDKLRKKPKASAEGGDTIEDEFAALQPVSEEQPVGAMFSSVKPEPAV